MQELQINQEQDFVVPDTANKLTVTHEWGDVVVSNVTVSGTYSYTSDSIGVHKFVWSNGITPVATEFYSFILPLISITDFFNDNEDLEPFEDDFAKLERMLRYTIQNFTGQKFGPYVNKTMEIQGDGGDSLYLPVPILALSAVANNYGDSILDTIEISPGDTRFLQVGSRFRGDYYYEPKRDITWNSYETFSDRFTFSITADWGYEYVPPEVSEAAVLLIQTFMGDSDLAEMRRNGVIRSQLGDFQIWLNADQWGSTGNAAADNLLAAYVNFGVAYI